MAKRKRSRKKERPERVSTGAEAAAHHSAATPDEGSPATPRIAALAGIGVLLVTGLSVVFWMRFTGEPNGADRAPLPGAGPSDSRVPSFEAASGHEEMLSRLREIFDATDKDNHWQGEGAAEPARQRLAALKPLSLEPSLGLSSSAATRWRLLLEVAEHELRLGNEQEALRLFEEARSLGPAVAGQLPVDQLAEAEFRRGVAYLRWGESANCATRHAPESCILPIRGVGVHVQREGSEKAMAAFEAVAERTARTSPLHLKSVWLLNIAAMTLGEHPAGVPTAYRLPPTAFGSDEPFPRFRNTAPSLGLDSFNLSGGAVVDDFTGDGLFDILTTTFDTRGEPHFFVNLGDGAFADRTDDANLRGLYGGLNLVHADYDNDGDLDVYILRGAWLYTGGRHPNSLLRNDGSGRFEDVTFELGLGDVSYPTQTAAWADYDNDGDVDLYVGNEHGDGTGRPDVAFEAPSQLFRNDGEDGFVDVATAAGVDVRAFVKGVIWGDYDQDRFPDLYVSVLGGDNYLFRNRGDGTFAEVAGELGVRGPENSFPVWFWDYDNDGQLDLYVPSYRGSRDGVAMVAGSYLGMKVPYDMPRLYRGDGLGGFRDVAARVGLDRLVLPMGSNFGDLDSDGFLDFYLGTGYPDYEAVMPNVLYRNDGGRRFADVTLAAGFGHLQKGHAVAFADVDQDGDQDIFAQMGGAFPGDRFSDALFENPGFDNRWIGIQLVGVDSNRAGIGARIRVDIVENGQRRSIHRWVNSGGSFGCNPLRQTIGLGKASEIEQIEVYWPTSDSRHLLSKVPMDRVLRVVEGGAFTEL